MATKTDYEIAVVYQGRHLTDKGVARLLFNDANTGTIESAVDWMLANCTNLNNINVATALQCLYYDFIGVSSNALWQKIDDYCDKLVEQGKINEW